MHGVKIEEAVMEKYRSETSVVYGNSTGNPDDNGGKGKTSDGYVHGRLRHCGSEERSDVMVDRPHASVQRSLSDVRHNSRPSRLQETRRGSNFELAYLLQKGRTLDAKLFGEEYAEEDEEEEDVQQTRLRSGSSDDGSSSPGSRSGGGGEGAGGGRIVLLPLRLRHALTKRRFSSSRIYPPRTSICGSLQSSTVSVSGPLDSLPELQPTEMLNQQSVTSINCSQAQKDKDIETAVLWLQQEIHSLKTQDRKLFRQLLGLGTEIHRMSGMKTCQSVNNSLDEDVDVTARRFIDSEANQNYVDHDDDDDDYLAMQGAAAAPPPDNAWQPKSINEVNNLKTNKLLDLYSSSDSFFL